MEFRPQNWSHHHTRRLYHLSMAVSFSFVAIISLLGSMVALWQVRADQVSLSATVQDINPGTTVIQGGGGGGTASDPANFPNINPPKNNPETQLQVPTQPGINAPKVSIELKPQELPKSMQDLLGPEAIRQISQVKNETVVLPGGAKVVAPVYLTQRPYFFGRTNIPNAIIFLEIHSTQVIRATTYANAEGFWVWHSLEAISSGVHTLTVASQDPEHLEIKAISKKVFVVRVAGEQESGTPLSLVPDLGNNGNLFDIIIRVQQGSKQVAPGDNLLASVKLINFGSAGNPIDVPVQYTIEDATHKVIMNTKETIAVATQISLVKSFYTSTQLADGTYTLIARAPTKDAIALASDTFEIKGVPVIALTETTRVNFTIIFQALIALFSLFFMVTYFEYNKVAALSRIIKQTSEADLKSLN